MAAVVSGLSLSNALIRYIASQKLATWGDAVRVRLIIYHGGLDTTSLQQAIKLVLS